ncbi:hypothetical protein [Erythrobacter sp. KY5]|uniref:hypothetical protein n=1 Tax=Erythrobacter sp. KY5 TaxID=2011159 RepID=UPI0013A6CB70|nr:hypothetical protein [Erythrobacter sp. KY5]
MALEMVDKGAVRIRRMRQSDIGDVAALIQSIIQRDQDNGRPPRLGPLDEDTVERSLIEYVGQSVVLESAERPRILACALILLFEDLEEEGVTYPPGLAEAAKLTLDPELYGTEVANLMHSIRIVSQALSERLGGQTLDLVYNVLSQNAGQLKHVEALGLRIRAPRGYLKAVLEAREANLNLSGQKILTFDVSDEAIGIALTSIFDLVGSGSFSRRLMGASSPQIEGWAVQLDHPFFGDELPILKCLADEIGLQTPRWMATASGSMIT